MRRRCPKLEGGMRRNVAGARSEGLRLRLKVRGGKLGGGAPFEGGRGARYK